MLSARQRHLDVGIGAVALLLRDNSSRGTWRMTSSTRASSTSQARTCCSIICSRASAVYIWWPLRIVLIAVR